MSSCILHLPTYIVAFTIRCFFFVTKRHFLVVSMCSSFSKNGDKQKCSSDLPLATRHKRALKRHNIFTTALSACVENKRGLKRHILLNRHFFHETTRNTVASPNLTFCSKLDQLAGPMESLYFNSSPNRKHLVSIVSKGDCSLNSKYHGSQGADIPRPNPNKSPDRPSTASRRLHGLHVKATLIDELAGLVPID